MKCGEAKVSCERKQYLSNEVKINQSPWKQRVDIVGGLRL